ncbi:MAG: hypothetical protein AAGD25_33215 [Cyanobacteria bacterium P01_F01_bin.150]
MIHYLYKTYGICIQSNIQLPELLPADGVADLTIQVDYDGDEVYHIRQQPSFFEGKLPGIGTFYIRQGKVIIVEPHTSNLDALRPTILGGALAVALRQRGLLVLHASCVNVGNQAIAFMGDSGWGKSTLAAAFHNQGYPILTDDVMAIQAEWAAPLVLPGFPQIKLWPDAADSLVHQPDHLPALYPNAPKLSYRFEQGFQQESLPLTHLYILRKGTSEDSFCQIRPLFHRAAFLELVRHTREMMGMKDAEVRKAHFHQCNTLLQAVRISYLIRRPQLSDLVDLVGHIQRDVLDSSDANSS